LKEAEGLLMSAGAFHDEAGQAACAGHVLSNLAGMMSLTGRMADAERLAEESVRILEKWYVADDWMLLRPLQVLAAVRLELGKTARAREAVRRVQSVRVRRPEESAIVHATAGALLQVEGRRPEAEAEYQTALRAWEESGRGESADAGAILHCVAALYLEEDRLEEAGRILDRALAIYMRAKDAVSMDHIKFLDLRAVLHARLGEWQQSEQDLRDALSMVDREPSIDPALVRSLLGNYARVLRRNHRRREARSIEARAAALPENHAAAAVVDFTELRGSGAER
jgi:tetratricopeptide (TPR) repeat protein